MLTSEIGRPRMEGGLAEALANAENDLKGLGEIEHAERLSMLRKVYDAPDLRVVIFGEFSRGKSTLINALLGRDVLPAKAMPTTGHVTRIVRGPHDEVRAQFRGGRVEACPLDRLDSFTTLDFDRQAREDVEAIEVAVDCPALRDGLVLIDTPGVCDPGAQTERALRAIASADLVVLVLNATQLLTENEHGLAVDWMSQGLGKPVVPVLNWMNVVEERDRAELRQLLDRWSREHLGGELGRHWFEVNAKGALMHVVGGGPAPTDDFFALRSALSGLTGDRRRRLQAHSRRGQLRADMAQARRANLDVLHRIRRGADRVEREREAARCDLRLLSDRFDADAKLKRESLTTSATAALNSKLDRLVSFWFAGESKERLKANANDWYQKMLSEGVKQIEKESEGALLALTGDGLRRPEPITIREHVILARLDVGELKPEFNEGADVLGGLIGGGLGTFLLPGVGTVLGAGLGVLASRALTSKEPDYVAAYSTKARENWSVPATKILNLLRGQYDARVSHLKQQIAQRLEQIDAGSGGDGFVTELRRREATEAALGRCEELLRTA